MRIGQTLFANAASLAVRLGANFALNKILAVLIGPASFALLGQLQNFMMLVQNATGSLLVNGVTKLTAQAEGDLPRQRQIWSTAFSAVVALSLSAAVIIILARGLIAQTLLGDAIYSVPLLLFALTLTAFGINFLIATIFAGKSDVRPFATINTAMALINLFVVSAGAYWGEVEGALIATSVSQSLALVIGLFLINNRKWYGLGLTKPLFDFEISRALAKYGAMTLTAAVGLAVGQLAVRSQIIGEFGLVTAGIYEALWRLGTINQLLFSTTLLVYVLPRMSKMENGAAFRIFYFKALTGATALAGVILFAEYLTRVPLFHLLFTSEFEPAAEYFGYQAIGDVARVTTLVTSTAMIAQSRAGLFIALEIIRFVVFVAAPYFLISEFGKDAPALAYMAAYCVSAVTGVALMLISGSRDTGMQRA